MIIILNQCSARAASRSSGQVKGEATISTLGHNERRRYFPLPVSSPLGAAVSLPGLVRLAAADFALAERLLGRPYRIAGRVLHGQKLARQLGTPTANIQLKRRRVPFTGVCLVSVDLDGKTWPGVANIGVRPTVQGDGKAHLEVHLLDFAGDLYDRRMTVVFHQKLREEQRFASLEALKTAINADVAAARALSHLAPIANEEP